MTDAEMAGRERGEDSFQCILLSSFVWCLHKPLFSPFKLQLLFSLLKPQTSQKFLDKSLSFPLFTQNICHLLRNVRYSRSFVQTDFHLFYFIYSRFTIILHRIILSLSEDGAEV